MDKKQPSLAAMGALAVPIPSGLMVPMESGGEPGVFRVRHEEATPATGLKLNFWGRPVNRGSARRGDLESRRNREARRREKRLKAQGLRLIPMESGEGKGKP